MTITFSLSRRAAVIISATGNVAGALTVIDRGNATPGAGEISIQDGGTTAKIEASSTDTAVAVVYVMQPGIGTAPGLTDSLVERLALPYAYGEPTNAV